MYDFHITYFFVENKSTNASLAYVKAQKQHAQYGQLFVEVANYSDSFILGIIYLLNHEDGKILASTL
ncbi:hypothetical protein CAL7716_010900 [Calothrix sp. PCC 7716]|nr:hypothetical protein CAL7716_010900 [Calothrix sp. PCC 7716]